jgi:hypothetical protein
METRLISKDGQSYLACIPGEICLQSERDALDLTAACGENDTDRLMLHASNLSDDFFDLKTRLAGDILLKFTNYRIRVAAVIPKERIGTGHFAEFVWETNRGNQFRVFETRELAERWLVGN